MVKLLAAPPRFLVMGTRAQEEYDLRYILAVVAGFVFKGA